jgi:hypothetical protein
MCLCLSRGEEAIEDQTDANATDYYYYYGYYFLGEEGQEEEEARETYSIADGIVELKSAQDFEDLLERSLPQRKGRAGADLMVLFYAPWCGYCKKLLPQYSKLALLLNTSDGSSTKGTTGSDDRVHPKTIIAKLDATSIGDYYIRLLVYHSNLTSPFVLSLSGVPLLQS